MTDIVALWPIHMWGYIDTFVCAHWCTLYMCIHVYSRTPLCLITLCGTGATSIITSVSTLKKEKVASCKLFIFYIIMFVFISAQIVFIFIDWEEVCLLVSHSTALVFLVDVFVLYFFSVLGSDVCVDPLVHTHVHTHTHTHTITCFMMSLQCVTCDCHQFCVSHAFCWLLWVVADSCGGGVHHLCCACIGSGAPGGHLLQEESQASTQPLIYEPMLSCCNDERKKLNDRSASYHQHVFACSLSR